jgi:hypothetical protein
MWHSATFVAQICVVLNLALWESDRKYLLVWICGPGEEDQLGRWCGHIYKYYIQSRRKEIPTYNKTKEGYLDLLRLA